MGVLPMTADRKPSALDMSTKTLPCLTSNWITGTAVAVFELASHVAVTPDLKLTEAAPTWLPPVAPMRFSGRVESSGVPLRFIWSSPLRIPEGGLRENPAGG